MTDTGRTPMENTMQTNTPIQITAGLTDRTHLDGAGRLRTRRHREDADRVRRDAGLDASFRDRNEVDDNGRHSSRFAPAPETSRRKLVVIDLDNVTGMRELQIEEWDSLLRGMRTLLGITDGDHVIISMCRRTLSQAMVALAEASAQLLAKDGPDGAELAIEEALNIAHAAARYGTLVIVSGDHFFTSLVHDAHRHGMRVRQVSSNRAGCSTILRRAADTWNELDAERLITGAGGPLTARLPAIAS
ncbi:MAG: NYN domain-containing protein [Nocardioides sp.]